jgi:hypothetical protein
MSDDNDTAGRVHRKRYGRSDKANARENRNPEFQGGVRGQCANIDMPSRDFGFLSLRAWPSSQAWH